MKQNKTIAELVAQARSYRRFDSSYVITQVMLRELIDLARLAPSTKNDQRLKYMPITDKVDCATIYPSLRWAGYLTDWDGPTENERPTAYIIVLHDKTLGAYAPVDAGLATQNIILGAAEKELGCCIIMSCDKPEIARRMDIDTTRYEIVHVIALGRPVEKVVIEPMKDGDVKYWRDEEQTHHVPKRALDEIIVRE